MKKLCRSTTMLCMLVLAGCTCLGGPRAPESELTIRRTVDIPGYTQEQIYDEAKAWSVKKFGKRGIQRDNKKAGVLVSTAAMGYRGFWKGLLSMSSKIVKFRMKLEAEDDMFHLTFDDLRIAETNTSHHVGEYGSFSYPYKMEYPVSRQDDLDEIKPKLHEIGDKMAEAIQCLEKLPPRETVETVKTPADVPISDKDDRYTELMKLKKLLDEGIITQEEFDTEKKEILKKY